MFRHVHTHTSTWNLEVCYELFWMIWKQDDNRFTGEMLEKGKWKKRAVFMLARLVSWKQPQ